MKWLDKLTGLSDLKETDNAMYVLSVMGEYNTLKKKLKLKEEKERELDNICFKFREIGRLEGK